MVSTLNFPLPWWERVRVRVRGSALALLILFSVTAQAACDEPLLTLKLNTTTIHAEVAKTPAEREKGLMNRKSLPKNWGMWFTFGGPSNSAFWMKDTYVPLDIIFVGRDMKIVHIHANARPLDLSLIASPLPYWYVLEVPAGFAKAKGLTPGMPIQNQTPGC